MNDDLQSSQLGKQSSYETSYNPKLIFPIPREGKRREIGLDNELPFHGVDIWNGYELSWLNSKGKPLVAIAEFSFPYDSTHIVESKSFKLYLNSFNQTKFDHLKDVETTLKKDLSSAVGKEVEVTIFTPDTVDNLLLGGFDGVCLDELDIAIDQYELDPEILSVKKNYVKERVYSRLLKSNCLVTGQPDWASVFISYEGDQINHSNLLKYLISFRNHNEFHEQCVERIFMDLLKKCEPEKLTVYARYTRRGGLDINPFRSNYELPPQNIRHFRQ